MNKFLGVGNIGGPPEPILNGCKLSLCTEVWDGKKSKNIWLKIFVFGKAAEFCLKFLETGRKIEVEGRIDLTVKGNMVIITDKVVAL